MNELIQSCFIRHPPQLVSPSFGSSIDVAVRLTGPYTIEIRVTTNGGISVQFTLSLNDKGESKIIIVQVVGVEVHTEQLQARLEEVCRKTGDLLLAIHWMMVKGLPL